jgi:diadenosine tetraphosphatase ApaH/serine/threonine PP2A family protein phosphatase
MTDSPERSFYTMDDRVDLTSVEKALINVGSVGQPRDEDPRAAVGMFDTETLQYELVRVEYNIKIEAQRIQSAGLPKMLSDRLFLGI